jgi:uncharacterized protein
MKRHIFAQLQSWKQDSRRKPLILMGARQVGKTHSLKHFASAEYDNMVYLNFEDQPSLKSLFENNLKPHELLKMMALEMDVVIKPEKTLIIFDEVQECPNALNSLKYFNESANEYHIAAAGSLLGVKLVHTKGFPVGKVNFLHLYPLSFFEFLNAIGVYRFVEYLQDIQICKPLPLTIHEKCLHYFKIYCFTGGMPEAVVEYAASEDFNKVRTVQQEILNAYALDFAKHAPTNQTMKISQVWQSIPSQFAKENKKFIYSVVRQGARAKEFEVALQWLSEAGIIHKVYNLSNAKLPLDGYAKFEFFKVYLLDVGLLGAMSNLAAKTIIHNHQLFQEFRGALIENVVAQELVIKHAKLYYWTSTGKAEVDFIFQQEDQIYPLEVKSGATGRAKSLRVYADKYKPKISIRTSPMNLNKNGSILNCPLYLISELPRLLDIPKALSF